MGTIEAVFDALNAAGVRYLVVGGVAVVLHGHLRTTADLDLVVQRHDERDAERIGHDLHRRQQARMGLTMTPLERLRWLEETMETMRRWQGRAGESRWSRPAVGDRVEGPPQP